MIQKKIDLRFQPTTQEKRFMTQAGKLIKKFQARDARVAVIGLGYVGLPLAIAFAEAGFSVMGIDLNDERVTSLNTGQSYISDVPSERLAALLIANTDWSPADYDSQQSMVNGRLTATTNFDFLSDADAIIICVPTPLSKTKDPDMSYITAAIDEIAQRLHPGMLIVLESTTYPGTTEEFILPRLEDAYIQQKTSSNGRVAAVDVPWSVVSGEMNSAADGSRIMIGRDFFLAFSPERTDPGRTDYSVHSTPKVLAGVTPQCRQVAQALYECVIKHIVPVSSPKVAEMVKLLENTFRAVNIALANEVAIMCDRLGVDVWEVIEAAKTKPFGFMPFYPGPGLGGHCIPIDPQYLSWKLKTLNYNARFIQLAAEINFHMPQYVLGKITDALNEVGKALKRARVLVLGVAYKRDVGDIRESPALDLIRLLLEKGAYVTYHDPYVPELGIDDLDLKSVMLDAMSLQATDCVVIVTDHSGYDWEWVVENSKLVVDTRNATKPVASKSTRVVKL